MMSISAYREVTEWKDTEFRMPQHIYLFDGKSNALAYAKEGQEDIFIFKAPLKIDTRRRKFEKVKHKALDKFGKTVILKPDAKADGVTSFEVKSDSGKTYVVTLESGKYQCNCVGYSYRGKCKHSEQITKAQEK
jgi:hypothetical protein